MLLTKQEVYACITLLDEALFALKTLREGKGNIQDEEFGEIIAELEVFLKRAKAKM